jgi:hypothetical protein
VRYAVDAIGRPGLLQHRSHQVVPIDRCLIAHPAIQELDLLAREWPQADALEAVASTGGDVATVAHPAGAGALPDDDLIEGPPLGGGNRILLGGPAEVTEVAAGRDWGVPLDGFWQVHPAAADTLTATVVEMLRPAAGETSWDLYGGVGLFAAVLAERTGARTTLVESSPVGVAAARANLADQPVRSTWWCWTRRGPERAPRWCRRSPPPGPGPWPMWPATRRPWPGTWRPSARWAGNSSSCGRSTVSR